MSESGDSSVATEDLIKLQNNRYESLKQMLVNFKKASSTRKTKIYHEQRLKMLNDLYNSFSETHRTIICSEITDDDTYIKNQISFEFEESYLEVFCAISESCEKLYPPSASDNIQHTSTQPVQQTSSSVKLPNLPVPTFSGKFTEWSGFHDSFNRLIHLNVELNAIQKFHYLKKALPADRDVDIQQLLLTEANYTTAWETLVKRYNNPRIIFMHHMNTLYNLPCQIKERSEDLKGMLNVANVCINEFKRLNIPISQCDHWIAHYLSSKLSPETHKAWEQNLGSKIQIPSFSEFEIFLNNRLITIDAIENRCITNNLPTSSKSSTESVKPIYTPGALKNSKRYTNSSIKTETKTFHLTTKPNVDKCVHCGEPHVLRRCPTYLSKDCFERKAIVDKAKLCSNCLSKSHTFSQCISPKNCLECGKRHHTSLHFSNYSKVSSANNLNQSTAEVNLPSTSQQIHTAATTPTSNTHVGANANFSRGLNTHTTSVFKTNEMISATATAKSQQKVLLATALVSIFNYHTGQSAILRALVDQGSEGTIISEYAVQLLGLKKRSTSAEISGVGQGAPNQCKFVVSFTLRSCTNSNFTFDVDTTYVLNSLTTTLPSQYIEPQSSSHLHGINLADPTYNQPNRVDIIIGADMLSNILLPDIRIGAPDQPIAQNTQLGWILYGRTRPTNTNSVSIRCNHATIELEALVQKFYEIEQVPEERMLSLEDQWCEDFFKTTHIRQPNGKYMVRLPLKSIYDPNQTLGKSKQIALNRFYQLERRLQRNPKLCERYTSGIDEYFELNQIIAAQTTENQHCTTTKTKKPTVTSCVLPHHAVIKEESLTTKVRIVFDASSKTTNGRSLNDLLCVGPTLQNDLSAVILNWRMHKYVFTADIQKMYRCIDMHPDDTSYQRILWRSKSGAMQEFCLTTVTFGTASAPYTAIKIMHQIAEDEKDRFPLAENVLKHEMYVDDVQTGSHSVESTIQIRNQLIGALQSAGMELRKWSSNSSTILQAIPVEHQSSGTLLQLDSSETVKILGMCWQPCTDKFQFKLNFQIDPTPTKRVVLSTIARLFDPLGLISPIITTAKIILKCIWNTKIVRADQSSTSLEWDEALPDSLNIRWQQFLSDLSNIEQITIPRWIKFIPQSIESIELHSFCDGSSSAYAANIYIRIQYSDGQIFARLLVAKSKVTPTKPITIPRIELCGAVLAIKLAAWVKKQMRAPVPDIPIFYWIDATIVLYWINGDINRWKTFVANRIGKILTSSKPNQWNHISTDENPADCATRGLTPAQLLNFNLWWMGPRWLAESKSNWPTYNISDNEFDDEVAEAKPLHLNVNFSISSESIIFKYSTYSKLLRVNAFILRFSHNSRKINKTNRIIGPLTVTELQQSLRKLVRLVQKETFGKEIQCILSNEPLSSKSKLHSLTPFLDEDDILRIRGRCQRSNLPYNQKHPMILPNNHHFTQLVISNAHHNTLHGGTQLTLSNILQQFWILKGRQSIRNHLRKCVTCFRNKPEVVHQLMGNLPYHRVNPPQRAFLATGVDYTGAIELKSSKYRGNTTYKGYIAIFICLATKAIHLEAVTGMSTECFLWALQRFIGRRGICHDLYSDCGTNFIGADRVLQTTKNNFIESVEHEIVPKLASQNIQWHFNPPHSPNFGGLWEANVKSVKYHLKRTIDSTRLTYEELSTVLVRIESCLNSRPLCPLTADPDDLDVLTPGHFLIGDSLLSPPDATSNQPGISQNYLNLQKMAQQFWSKWTSNWLSHLQARPKWRQETSNLQLNDLVIIKDDRVPINEWILGRVIELHPGMDNLVRVVTVRTKNGNYKRCVSKICRLPIPTYTEEITQAKQN